MTVEGVVECIFEQRMHLENFSTALDY